MKAMILAAGLGTRLKPWTLHHPKALVPVGGVPMLKRVIERLRNYGADYIVVNVHHFADQIIDYLKSENFGIEIAISDERLQLLDTGGGIVNALPLLSRKPGPVLIHNVDILSNAPLNEMMRIHEEQGNDVSLLINDRDSSRKLGFDSRMNLLGRINYTNGHCDPEGFNPDKSALLRAFSGIYALSENAIDMLAALYGRNPFPVMDFFLNRQSGVNIKGIDMPGLKLIDIGKPDTLHKANTLNEIGGF